MFPFNYINLINDGLIYINTSNPFAELNGISIDNWNFQTFSGKWDYYGQVDSETGSKPNGVGIAIRSDEKGHGEILEGDFKDGTG